MPNQRKYSEKEIAAIFEKAADSQKKAQENRQSTEGLTLSELQEIGDELGLTSEFIAQAAKELAQPAPVEYKSEPVTYVGIPISVEHVIDLPENLSTENWERLIVDLRRTFQAQGEVSQNGSLRQWRNGNLQVSIEPTEAGHRIRMFSLKQSTRDIMNAGLVMSGLMLIILLLAMVSANVIDGKVFGMSLVLAIGLGSFGFSAAQLSGWRKERKSQMKKLADRAVALAESQVKADQVTSGQRLSTPTPEISLDNLPAEERAATSEQRNSTRTKN